MANLKICHYSLRSDAVVSRIPRHYAQLHVTMQIGLYHPLQCRGSPVSRTLVPYEQSRSSLWAFI